MGNYRNHRQPRGGGPDGSLDDADSEPSYFQRRAAPARPTRPAEPPSRATEAELLWFNAGKGFGFVRLNDGSDAFLHGSRLQAAGYSDLAEGARLTVRTEIGPKGPQVAEIVSVTGGGREAAPAHSARPAPEASARPEAEGPERPGVVKRYDPLKGFGFIAVDDGDIFVHASTLTRSGLSALDVGQQVIIKSGPGRKGLEVRAIRLA